MTRFPPGFGVRHARGPLVPQRDARKECEQFDDKVMLHRFTRQIRRVDVSEYGIFFVQAPA